MAKDRQEWRKIILEAKDHKGHALEEEGGGGGGGGGGEEEEEEEEEEEVGRRRNCRN